MLISKLSKYLGAQAFLEGSNFPSITSKFHMKSVTLQSKIMYSKKLKILKKKA
jgi:hypothetical protein